MRSDKFHKDKDKFHNKTISHKDEEKFHKYFNDLPLGISRNQLA